MKLIFSFLVFVPSLLHSFHLSKNGKIPSISSKIRMSNEEPNQLERFKSRLKSLPAILGTACLLLSQPMDSFAASSGGRSGGSSFKSSSSRSYSSSTRLNSGSYSGYAPRPTVSLSPIVVSPFGYGYGFGGFGLSPFSFIPINFNLLLIGGIAYAVYTVLSSRVGGSDFSNGDDSGSLGSGATVLKLTVGLDEDWGREGNIMDSLSSLAARKNVVSSRTELSSLLSEAALALLRKKGDWNSASLKGERFSGDKAENYFQRLAVDERAKFEKETSGQGALLIPITETGKKTQAIVTLVVAVRGRSDALTSKGVRSVSDVRDCLQTLASEALTDEGDNIMAVEVLWTPSERGSSISAREVISDYPELIQL